MLLKRFRVRDGSDLLFHNDNGSRHSVSGFARISCCFLAILFAFSGMLTGCSASDSTISETKKSSVRLLVNADTCAKAAKSSVNLSGGEKLDIPAEIEDLERNDVDFYGGAYHTWDMNHDSLQYQVQNKWREAGSTSDCGLPTINGRYGVVVSSTVADAGDYIDLVYTDGQVLSAVVLDTKSPSDGCFEYNGFVWGDDAGGGNWKMCEWILEPNGFYEGGVETFKGSKIGFAASGKVDYVMKYGSILNGDTAPSNNTGAVSSKGGSAATTKTSGTTSELIGDDTAEQIWNYLKACGYTDAVCAGLLGNAQQESGLNPACRGAAFGLWQFEMANQEYADWLEYCNSHGGKEDDVLTQLNFLFKDGYNNGESGYAEYTFNTNPRNGQVGHYNFNGNAQWGYSPHIEWSDYIKLNDIDQATEIWELIYEAASLPMMENRKKYAHEFYERFQGTGATAASEIAEDCDNNYSNDMTSTADGSAYHQTQGTHYGANCKDNPIDQDAQSSACGATSFTIGVNMLLGKPHEYCGVETFHEIKELYGSYTYELGADAWGPAATKWLESKNIADKISAEGANPQSPEELKQLLLDGKLVVCSTSGPNFCDNSGSTAGDSQHSGGHYILFYKYENGNFIASDCGRSEDHDACKYDEEHINAWFNARVGNHTACILSKK